MTALIFFKKVWDWLKEWGLWVLGGIAAFGGIVITARALTNKDDTELDLRPLPDVAREGEWAVAAVVSAVEERDAKLLELADKHKDLLDELSDEQERELEDLATKDIEEVTAWFAGLTGRR